MIKRFNRFELKYIIDLEMMQRLKGALAQQMVPDRLGGPDGGYSITSLYYDSEDLCCYRGKIEGIKFRRKLRVRKYGALSGDPQQKVMLEIKQRINRTTQKRRVDLTLTEAYAACSGADFASMPDPRDAAVAQEVQFLVRMLALRPACLVGYHRTAWVGGPYDPGLRVTFDRDITAASADRGLSPDTQRHAILPRTTVIMEVKVNEAVPLWLVRLLSEHSIPIQRFSKYCTCMAHLMQMGLPHGLTARTLHG